MNPSARITLSDGHSIPVLGLGVFRSPQGQMTYDSVKFAIESGYRHIDTASVYQNERDVGRAVAECAVPRSDLYITTKLWNSDQGYDSALRAFEKSLKNLGLDYLDLYLLHWPVPGLRLESWKALVRLQQEKRVRSIGVSNFIPRHLEELLQGSSVRPVINQVEMSPFLSQQELREFCAKHQIVIEAYSPLTKGLKLGHPTLIQIAARHNKSPAQVLLRWGMEKGAVVIPKSNRPERIVQNSQVFDFRLEPEELRLLDGLDENLHTGWDPSDED